MYRKIVNFLRGSVKLQIESPCPERVVNLCAAHEIPFWGLRWQDETHCTMQTTRRGLRDLRQVTEEVPCTIAQRGERGVPMLCRKLRRRYVLLGGAAVFLALLLWGNLCIWEFQVEGNDTVPTQTILRALEEYGVGVGTRGTAIDQEALRNHVLLELPDVSWLAVNVKGCVAHVQVVERQRPPRQVREEEITNVVSCRDGVVTEVRALEGMAQVAPGSTVTCGQLLISGVEDSTRSGVRFLHGMGTVEARTWYELSVQVPLAGQKRTVKQKTHRFALDFGKYRIKLYGKGRKTRAECDKIINYRPLILPGGLRLPLTIVQETCVVYETAPVQRSTRQAQAEGEAVLLRQLKEQMTEEGTVERKRFVTAEKDGCLLVTLKAECLEQIGTEMVLPRPQVEID